MTEQKPPPASQTDFGFESVSVDEKTRRVEAVFGSVASRYDLMNDLMSLGLHRVWKRFALFIAAPRRGYRVLDLAAGSGDLVRLHARAVGETGEVVALDINRDMIEVGRDRLLDVGVCRNVSWVRASAETLPFPEQSFDLVTIAFGLRNVTDKNAALQEMYRILRPGREAFVLEFSHVKQALLARMYDSYSFKILPRLGRIVARDEASYRYLAESIRMHPDQQHLAEMMRSAGFERVRYNNLHAGIVALHRGVRL